MRTTISRITPISNAKVKSQLPLQTNFRRKFLIWNFQLRFLFHLFSNFRLPSEHPPGGFLRPPFLPHCCELIHKYNISLMLHFDQVIHLSSGRICLINPVLELQELMRLFLFWDVIDNTKINWSCIFIREKILNPARSSTYTGWFYVLGWLHSTYLWVIDRLIMAKWRVTEWPTDGLKILNGHQSSCIN